MKNDLTRRLSEIEGFENPRISLEQYKTPPALAADLIFTAYMNEDIEGKEVLDLGTGTGMLGIGAALLGGEVTAVDKDEDALEQAEKNMKRLGVEMDIEQKDIEDVEEDFDTVVMNPPFSVHSEEGLKFFEKAFEVADSVYSVGPVSFEERIKDLAGKFDHRVSETESYTIELPPTFGFHTEAGKEVSVKIYITRRNDNGT